MTKQEYSDRTGRTSTSISEHQLTHMVAWVEKYINDNTETLKTVGIPPIEIYNAYLASTTFPVGLKGFAPCLYIFGLEKVGSGSSGGFRYVMFTK